MSAAGIETRNVWTSVGPHEARIDLSQGNERPDHQPRDDQQDQGQRDLRHHERVARRGAAPVRRSLTGHLP